MRKEIEELEGQSARDGFWNDVENSQRVQKRLKQLKAKVENYEKLCSGWDDLMTLCEMAIEEGDDSMLPELQSEYAEFEKKLEETRLGTLLTGEYDANNAILTFHAGAGGTEAQDWTQMLYRMYNMWADRHGYTVKLMDYLDGDEAGIKSATIMIEGENAYGFLGSQIRSYVFMPYTLAKDHRTGYENGNIQNVMDGDIDGFINAFLAMKAAT